MNKRNLKVAMLLDNPFRPDPRVAREAEVLTEIGLEVTVFAWDRDDKQGYPEKEKIGNYQVTRIQVKTQNQLGFRQLFRFLIFAMKAFKMIVREDFDIIHCHDFLNLLVCIPLKIFKKASLVYDAHEIYWIMEAKKYPKPILMVLKLVEIFLLNFVDVFITVGKSRVNYYRQFYDKPIHLVGNWYDPKSQCNKTGRSFRHKLGIPEDAFVLAYTGTLGRQRVPEVIVECARQMKQSKISIYWIIAGQGSEENLVMQGALEDINLFFLGWVQDPSPIYASSDGLLYLIDETLPYAEYAAPNNLFISISWSLPLITLGIGEMKEILAPHDAGIFLNKANVNSLSEFVLRLMEDKDLYRRITQKSKGFTKYLFMAIIF